MGYIILWFVHFRNSRAEFTNFTNFFFLVLLGAIFLVPIGIASKVSAYILVMILTHSFASKTVQIQASKRFLIPVKRKN